MMLSAWRGVFFALAAVGLVVLSGLVLLILVRVSEGTPPDATPDSPVATEELSAADDVEEPREDTLETESAATGNGMDTAVEDNPVRLRPVGDESVQRGVRFREYTVNTSPRLILNGMEVQTGLGLATPLEENTLDRLLDLGSATLDTRSPLWRELETDLNRLGAVRAAYLVPTETEEFLQFVLFHEEQASLVNLYLRGGRVEDGEVIPREWSRRSTLSTGSSADSPLFP